MFGALRELIGRGSEDIQHGIKKVTDTPANLLNSVFHPVRQPQPTHIHTPAAVENGSALPTDVGRVWGTLATENAANKQGWSSMLRNIVRGTNPFVESKISPLDTNGGIREGLPTSNSDAGGAYIPGLNRISLKSTQLDPYTVTHEGLHAAYDRKTPEAQQQFMDRVASTATPGQRRIIGKTLNNPLYDKTADGGGYYRDTEVHSYLPEYGLESPEQKQYYGHYFSNPDFHQEGRARRTLQDIISPVRSKFSDWMDD
jgi:hypothetical protein